MQRDGVTWYTTRGHGDAEKPMSRINVKKEGKVMRMRKISALVLIVSACSLILTNAFAEEKKYELKPTSDIKDVLKENIGKMAYIKLGSGEELNGSVVKVGDHLVHLARLSGRDFYDAAIRIDRISAVVFKVRGN